MECMSEYTEYCNTCEFVVSCGYREKTPMDEIVEDLDDLTTMIEAIADTPDGIDTPLYGDMFYLISCLYDSVDQIRAKLI